MKNSTNLFDSYKEEIFENDIVMYQYCYDCKIYSGKVYRYKTVWLIDSDNDRCKPFVNNKAFSYIRVIRDI